MIIAIDGPAASGKGTLARRIAAHFGYGCLDTGLLYRAVARDVMAAGRSLEDEGFAARIAETLDTESLDDPALRLPGVATAASVVAKFPAVRRALLELQRNFGVARAGGGSRRPGHRHGGLPGCRRQNLRHGGARGSSPPPLRRVRGREVSRSRSTT